MAVPTSPPSPPKEQKPSQAPTDPPGEVNSAATYGHERGTTDDNLPLDDPESVVDNDEDDEIGSDTASRYSRELRCSFSVPVLPTQALSKLPPPSAPTPIPRVRFNSRVRITGGARRRRLSDGAASSLSGSPASSISAPIHSATHLSARGWGPLGARVSLLASSRDLGNPQPLPQPVPHPRPILRTQSSHSRSARSTPDDYGVQYAGGHPGRRKGNYDSDVDERTPLMSRLYYAPDDMSADEEREWREQVISEHFGRWPQRLLNHHWWWWKMEPIVCCLCLDCSEEDE